MSKVVLILVPLVLIGAAAGLVVTGVVKTPWTTAVKKKGKDVEVTKATPPPAFHADAKPKPNPKPKLVVATAPKAKEDLDQGAEVLAKTWNEVDTKKLVEILKTWKDPEAAQVLMNMEASKVAEILSALDPARASKLCHVMEKQAAIVKPAA